jgi:hypothetical protein
MTGDGKKRGVPMYFRGTASSQRKKVSSSSSSDSKEGMDEVEGEGGRRGPMKGVSGRSRPIVEVSIPAYASGSMLEREDKDGDCSLTAP